MTQNETRSNLLGELRVGSPVWLYGPFPTLLRTMKTDDVYICQIRYPISPPFPKSCWAYSNNGHAVPGEVLMSGELAFLTTAPQVSSGLGVGYLAVMVKAFSKGRSSITVEVTLDDGSVERISFDFEVGDGRKSVSYRSQSPE